MASHILAGMGSVPAVVRAAVVRVDDSPGSRIEGPDCFTLCIIDAAFASKSSTSAAGRIAIMVCPQLLAAFFDLQTSRTNRKSTHTHIHTHINTAQSRMAIMVCPQLLAAFFDLKNKKRQIKQIADQHTHTDTTQTNSQMNPDRRARLLHALHNRRGLCLKIVD